MKIAFIGGKDIGGIASYVMSLSGQLKERNISSVIYFDSIRDCIDDTDKIKMIYQRPKGGKYFSKPYIAFRSVLSAVFNERDIDIFHFSNGFMLPLFAWIIKIWNPRSKIVVQIHSFAWMSPKYGRIARFIIKVGEFISVLPFKNFVVVSSEQEKILWKRYHKRSVIIPSSINEPLNFNDSSILDKFGLEKESYFLFLGRLDRIKNIDILIQAYIKSGITKKKLVIAGSNDEDAGYVKELFAMAVKYSGIIFTGAVYGLDKECLVKNCYTFCIQSSSEGLPISLLEAMSYERICITSDIPGNREAIGNDSLWVKVGNIDDLSEKIIFVADNIGCLEHQKKNNRDRAVSYYSWNKTADKYVNYIYSL